MSTIVAPKPPKPESWQDPADDTVNVVVDASREDLMNNLVTEVKNIRQNVFQGMLKLKDNESPSMVKLVNLFFGPDSAIFGKFKDLSGFADHRTFCQWLGGFFFASVIRFPYSAISETSSRKMFFLNSDKLANLCMPKDDYHRLWNVVMCQGLPVEKARKKKNRPNNYEIEAAGGCNPFWIEIQSEINALFSKMFTRNVQGKDISIIIDDDKHWHDVGCGEACLKFVKFPSDNREGFNLHTAAMSASGVVVSLEYERHEDAKSDYLHRLYTNMVGPVPSSQAGMGTKMDRGFTDWAEVYAAMVNGHRLYGSIKRSPWFPFTYDQVLKSTDHRQMILEKGISTILRRKTKIGGQRVTAFAHRDSKEHVTLLISNCFSSHTWELVLAKPGDVEWYKVDDLADRQGLRKRRWFTCVSDTTEATHGQFTQLMDELVEEEITPVTTETNHAAWFLLRSYSQTSSPSHEFLSDLKKFRPRDLESTGLIDMPSYLAVMEYLGDRTLLVDPDDDDEDEDSVGEEVDEADIETTVHEMLYTSTVESQQERADLCTAMKANRALSEAVIRAYHNAITGDVAPASRAVSALKKDVISFCEEDNLYKRHYLLMSSAKMWERVVRYGLASENEMQGRRGHKVTAEESRRRLIEQAEEEGQLPDRPTATARLRKTIMSRCIHAAYMKRLPRSAEKNTRRGHAMEGPLVENFLGHCKNIPGSVLFPAKFIALPGFVKRKGDLSAQAQKTSIDAIGGYEDNNGEKKLFGIELKTRVNNNTEQEAREIGRKQSIKEATQILHHASVYNFDLVLLLLGDRNGSILKGIWVGFDEQIRRSYRTLLRNGYNIGLKWIYEFEGTTLRQINNVRLPREVKDILNHPMIHTTPTELRNDIARWRVMQTKLALPIPKIARVVPLVCGAWNQNKGGSDTVTQSLDRLDCLPPVDGAQAHAVARLLQLCAKNIHKLYQIGGAKVDIRKYTTIQRYRNAASHRQTYPFSVVKLAEILLCGIPTGASPMRTPANEGIDVVRPTIRARRGRMTAVDTREGTESTGDTPARKRRKSDSDHNTPAVERIGMVDVSSMGPVVRARLRACTGCPIFRLSPELLKDKTANKHGTGATGTCIVCGYKRCRWFCTGCHFWYCMAPKESARKKGSASGVPDGRQQEGQEPTPDIARFPHIVDRKERPIVTFNCCYQQQHFQDLTGSAQRSSSAGQPGGHAEEEDGDPGVNRVLYQTEEL